MGQRRRLLRGEAVPWSMGRGHRGVSVVPVLVLLLVILSPSVKEGV